MIRCSTVSLFFSWTWTQILLIDRDIFITPTMHSLGNLGNRKMPVGPMGMDMKVGNKSHGYPYSLLFLNPRTLDSLLMKSFPGPSSYPVVIPALSRKNGGLERPPDPGSGSGRQQGGLCQQSVETLNHLFGVIRYHRTGVFAKREEEMVRGPFPSHSAVWCISVILRFPR